MSKCTIELYCDLLSFCFSSQSSYRRFLRLTHNSADSEEFFCIYIASVNLKGFAWKLYQNFLNKNLLQRVSETMNSHSSARHDQLTFKAAKLKPLPRKFCNQIFSLSLFASGVANKEILVQNLIRESLKYFEVETNSLLLNYVPDTNLLNYVPTSINLFSCSLQPDCRIHKWISSHKQNRDTG